MTGETQLRMTGLVTTQVLFEFKQAARALYQDLAFGEDEFDPADVRNFMVHKLRETMLFTEIEGPPVEEQDEQRLTTT